MAKVGHIEVHADREHAIPLAPMLSGAALLGGIILLIIGAGRHKTA